MFVKLSSFDEKVCDLPNFVPMQGKKNIATINELERSAISVRGKYLINCPGIPGQKRSGVATIKTVTTEENTGINILLADLLNASG